MRRTVLLLASVVLAVLLFAAVPGSAPPTAAREGPAGPNFVFVLADDMRKDDLKYMRKIRALLGDKGMRFVNAFVSYGLCCPSRATILRGQYAHNHGVWSNGNDADASDGGWEGFNAHGNEQDNLATRLDDAGYRTGLFGKYLNHYKETTVPPGWDDWFALVSSGYFDYNVNDNRIRRDFGTRERDYVTDVLNRQTQKFIDASLNRGKPFFAYVAPNAPHSVSTPTRATSMSSTASRHHACPPSRRTKLATNPLGYNRCQSSTAPGSQR